MWSCDTCGRPNKSNPLICETCFAGAPHVDAAKVSLALQRDLPMEAHLRALAFWCRVGAVLLVAVGVVVLLRERSMGRGAGALGAMAVGGWILGHFLARFANGARIGAAIVGIVGLALTTVRFAVTAAAYSRFGDPYAAESYFPKPSLVGPTASFVLSASCTIALFWTLLSSRAALVCGPAYRTIVARTRAMKAPMVRSPFFLVPLAALVLVVLMALMVLARARG